MSFADWVNNGWLVAHTSSKQEIANLLGIVARDLKDSQAKGVSNDWRFAMIGIARTLQQDVEQWMRTNHASLL